MIWFWYHPPLIWANGIVFGVTTLLVLSSFSVILSSLNLKTIWLWFQLLLSLLGDILPLGPLFLPSSSNSCFYPFKSSFIYSQPWWFYPLPQTLRFSAFHWAITVQFKSLMLFVPNPFSALNFEEYLPLSFEFEEYVHQDQKLGFIRELLPFILASVTWRRVGLGGVFISKALCPLFWLI